MLPPLTFVLVNIIATILYTCGYAAIWQAAILVTVNCIIQWHHQNISIALITSAIMLSSIGYIQIHRIQQHFYQTQQLADRALSGYGVVTDITPAHLQQRRMATVYLYAQSDQPDMYLYITVPHNKDIEAGDIIHIHYINIPRITKMSFAWHLMRTSCAGYIYKPPKIHVIHRPRWSIQRTMCATRNHIVTSMYNNMRQDSADVVNHIFFGYKTAPHHIRTQFQEWGVAHMLARSGLHLVIFTACCAWLLGFTPVRYTIRYAILAVITSIYAGISWPTISFIRALAMLYAFYVCRYMRIRYQAIHWVICVAIVTLCWNPLHLLFLDFQLSFGLTFTLCWLFTYIISTQSRHETLA